MDYFLTGMKREILPGTIYIVPYEKENKFFQFLCNDPEDWDAQVVRLFKRSYPKESKPTPDEIAKGEILVHDHTCIYHVSKKCWREYGIAPIYGNKVIKFKEFRWDAYTPFDFMMKYNIAWRYWTLGEKSMLANKLPPQYKGADEGGLLFEGPLRDKLFNNRKSFFVGDHEKRIKQYEEFVKNDNSELANIIIPYSEYDWIYPASVRHSELLEDPTIRTIRDEDMVIPERGSIKSLKKISRLEFLLFDIKEDIRVFIGSLFRKDERERAITQWHHHLQH